MMFRSGGWGGHGSGSWCTANTVRVIYKFVVGTQSSCDNAPLCSHWPEVALYLHSVSLFIVSSLVLPVSFPLVCLATWPLTLYFGIKTTRLSACDSFVYTGPVLYALNLDSSLFLDYYIICCLL